MEGELEKLCSNISLTEGEKISISVTEGEVAEFRERGVNCLVGKLWSEKAVNKEAFKTVLSRIWRTVGRVVFKELQDNCWLFEFSGEADKCRVLEGKPWSYDRYALVLKEFDGKMAPSQMQFQHSPIWIQVHDMPLLCMNRGVGIKIGTSLGEIEDVDVAGDGAGWGRCLRLRVVIDLSQPLERGRALHFNGKSHWVHFKYEKLPMFCFQCGRVVHERKGCPVRYSQRIHATEEAKQWGTFLRADGPKKGRTDQRGKGGGFISSVEGSASDGGGRDECSRSKGSIGIDGNSGMERRRGNVEKGDDSRARFTGGEVHGENGANTGDTWVGCCNVGGEKGDEAVINGTEMVFNEATSQVNGDSVLANTHGPTQNMELAHDGLNGVRHKDVAESGGRIGGPSIRGWKRQARSLTAVAQNQLMANSSKRKRNVGLGGGRTKTGGRAKKVKNIEENLCLDSDELAGAEIQPRQQP